MTPHSSAPSIMALHSSIRGFRRAAVAIAMTLVTAVSGYAQQKQRYSSLGEALQSSPLLSGRGEPQNVVWLDGGTRFSFINTDPRTGRSEIRAYDPDRKSVV